MALKTLPPRVPPANQFSAPLEQKTAEPFYRSADYQRWRETVINRARGRCEWPGCGKTEKKMFADHIKERKDGGSSLDPNNGQCLCAKHHNLKTAHERKRRLER